MPRPKKDPAGKDPLSGIKVEKTEERTSGPIKIVLRLPVPKENEASLSSDVFPGGESEEILQSEDDDDQDDESRPFLTSDEIEMIRESAGTPSMLGQPNVSSIGSNSSKKKRKKKKKFKLTMPSQKAPTVKKGRKGEVDSDGKETKKFKKGVVDAVGIEREVDTDEKMSDIKSPSPVFVPDYSPLQLLLDSLLKSFEKKDPDKYFMQPVTDEIAPNYSTTIANPMDFSTMRHKIDSNEYKNLPEFKTDVELIAKNAMTYNDVGSIYYFAAKKLLNVADYLFSKEKLLFLQKTCPFMAQLTQTDLGVDLSKPVPIKPPKALANYACIIDDMSAEEVLVQVSSAAQAAAARLASRRPKVKTAFISSKSDGTATLKCLIPENVADGSQSTKKTFRLNDVVPKLKEGNPGMPRFEEHPANLIVPYNYLDYGPFASFAPLYDSTWSTLSKDDSDLLLATYGGEDTCAQYIESIKSFVEDSGDYLVRLVDGVLDSLTDGEHSKSLKKLNNKNSGVAEIIEPANQEQDANFQPSAFFDVTTSGSDIDVKLAEAGALLSELRNAQYERLSQPPPFVLTETPGPTIAETNLAHQLLNNLQFLSSQVEPGQLASTDAVRTVMTGGHPEDQTMDSNGSDDYDMDVFREFFQVENGT